MATDPALLSSWYDSYKSANPVGAPAAAPAQDNTPAAQAPAPAAGMLSGVAPPVSAPAQAPTGYNATSAAASVWKPDANSTVQGQLKNVLDAGGPLMSRATTRAAQQVNERGLLNSSIGVSAGQSALYDAATPIATADANTFAAAGKTNAELGSQVGMFNANATNDAAKFGTGATNDAATQVRDIQAKAESQNRQLTAQEQAQIRDITSQQGMQRAGFEQQTALQTQDFAQQNKTQAADLASRYNLANMDVQSRAALQQADAANQQKLQAANAALQTGLQASDAAVKQSMQQYDAALKQSMQGLDNESKLKIATMDTDTRVNLANIEAKYRKEMQANSSMASSYQSMVDSFTRIMLDKDLTDPGAKQTAMDNVTTLYSNVMKMQADISGLKIGDLVSAPPKPGAKETDAPTGTLPAPKSGAAPTLAPEPGGRITDPNNPDFDGANNRN